MISQTTSIDYEKVKQIFSAALELPAAERETFLAAQDANLRREVESLLRANEEAGDFLNEVSAVEVVQDSIGKSDLFIGRKIDKYCIEREIGRGGMGIVYLAMREDFHQQVALKLIKRGMDSDAILERFARERGILAALNHPNIARLLDGGTTDEGSPFFVMERVEGVPVDEYCKSGNLSEKEKLELFRKICAAVAFAHQKLVVHRDLKPSNILVDKTGEPKLLDFGIAKLLNSTDKETQTHQRVLTPAYASPEQIRGEQIGTTSDVYSLGVILEELLTDEKAARFARVERWKIVGDETKPEKRTNPNSMPSALRSSIIKGDLQNILAQATREDAAQRYASVEAFSEDLRRYLAGLPIAARRDTFTYRAEKFIRRNRVSVAAALLFVLTLIGGIIATVWQARIARQERAKAERRLENLRKSSSLMVNEIHGAIMNLPNSLEARKLLLQRAKEQLDSLAEDLEGNTQLQLDIAGAYQNIGFLPDKSLEERTEIFNRAIDIQRKILVADPNNLAARKGLALSFVNLSDFAKAKNELPAAADYNRQSIELLESVVSAEPDNLDHKTMLWNVYYNAAGTFNRMGKAADSLELCRRMIPTADELKAKNPKDTGNNQFRRPYLSHALAGGNLTYLGRYEEAAAEISTALEQCEKARKEYPDNQAPITDGAIFKRRMAKVLLETGKPDEAINYLQDLPSTLREYCAKYPKETRNFLSLAESENYYGRALKLKGNYTEAIEHFNQAIVTDEQIFTADQQQKQAKSDAAAAVAGRGEALIKSGKIAEGLADQHKALALYEELGAEASTDAFLLHDYADALQQTGETYLLAGAAKSPEKARDLLMRSLRIWSQMRERGILSQFDAQQPEKLQTRIKQI